MLIFGMVVASLVLIATIAIARHANYGWIVLLQLAVFFGPIVCMIAATPVLIQSAALAGLAIVAAVTGMKPRRFAVWASGVTLVAFLISGASAWNDWQETQEHREQLAFESLEGRLGIEFRDKNAHINPTLSEESAPELFHRLAQQEEQLDALYRVGQNRAEEIRRLHEDTINQFVNSPGFGVTRMSRYGRYRIKTDDPGPIAQPKMPSLPYDPDDRSLPDSVSPSDPLPEEALREMHFVSSADFVNPAGYGYRNEQGLVAGFESHRFSKLPSPGNTEMMQLARVELISLLKQDEPRVYVSEYLPRMDELRDAPTRVATQFERDAIEQFRRGEDFAIRINGHQVDAVGSLRALSQCLECHNVNRGDLLGGFSYEFRSEQVISANQGPES